MKKALIAALVLLLTPTLAQAKVTLCKKGCTPNGQRSDTRH